MMRNRFDSFRSKTCRRRVEESKIVIDSGTEHSEPFVMPIGYATCSVYGMSVDAREKNKRLPDYVMRVRWVSKDYHFTCTYDVSDGGLISDAGIRTNGAVG